MADSIKEIKGYQVQGTLGEGGFGTVYRAYQPLIKREVAIKVIRASYANQPEFIRRFEAEAQLVARLEHLHIVPLYDFWRDPSGAYLIMRMLRGGSLREELQSNGRFSLEDVQRIITQISSALSVAHRKGVVHRDLKPANILLDEERNAYLTDFGIAKDVEHSSETDDDDDDGMIVGTPAYSPPEQLQSLTPTPQSDIYSFGLIIYELITGTDAMAGDSISDAIRNQLYEPLPEIDPDEYGVPMSINEILATATAKNPDDRYTDIMLFARDFKHAVSGFNSQPMRQLDIETGEMVIVPEDTKSFSIDMADISPTTGSQLAIINPYKGLRAFQESDASDFYGRASLTQKLLSRLQEDRADARFLAVIGPSGSGKSSVVKAGVIPAIRQGALNDLDDFYIAEMVPSSDALDELETVLLSIAVSPPDNMRQRLEASETGLFDILNEILPDDGSELFLLIDQFEEVFTQTEDNRVRTHFMDSLQYAINHPESRLWTVITIRADFYDKPLLYPKFGELVRERTEVVLPLSHNELESAIVQPAKNMGIQMEYELIERIIRDVQEEPGALPLLQYALTELFDRRDGLIMTLETYNESGGVLGSLARRAEELYVEMDAKHQESVRQLFLRLVTLGEGTEDTRRRVLWSELAFYDGSDDPMSDVLDIFTKYRLLTGDNDPQTREPTVEVAHEALIRQWQRLRDWLADNRDNIRVQRQVVAAVNEWHQNDKDNSYLASGMRLEQFEILLDSDDIALTLEEKNYIEASVQHREVILREEEERQARERATEERAQRNLRYLVGAMTVGLIIASALAFTAFNQRQAAISAQEVAEREAIVNNSISLSNLARFWGRNGEEPLLGLGYAIEANTIESPPVEVQQTLAELAWQPGARRHLIEHRGETWGVVYTPDGRYVLTGAGSFTGDPDNRLIQWDVNTGDIVRELDEHDDRIYSIAVSPDGQYIATGSQDTSVIIWNFETGEVLHRLGNDAIGHSAPLFNVMFTNDSSQMISAGADGVIIVWDVLTGEVINRFTNIHSEHILDMDITSDDSLIFSGSFDGTVRLWELETGNIVQGMDAGQVTGARFFPDETQAVTTDQNGELIIWDLATGDALRTIEHEEAPLRGGVVVMSDGQQLVSADDNGNVMVWDLSNETNEPVLMLRGHDARVPSLDISPLGGEVATVSFDSTAIIWDLVGRDAEIQRFNDHTGAVYSSTISEDGRLTASGSSDGRIIIWDTVSGEILHDIQEDGFETVYSLDFNRDAMQLISASGDGNVTLWDTSTGESLQTFVGLEAPVRQVVFSPDDSLIVAGGGYVQISDTRNPDNRLILWDINGNVVQTFEGHQATIRSIAFSPDGSQILSASDDTQIILWNTETGEQIRSYDAHTDAVWSVSFNADGSQFLSASRDTLIIHWETETGNILNRLLGHQTGVRAVAFHPDGLHAVSGAGDIATTGGAEDYELLYWDVSEASVLREMPGHSETIRSLMFNSDGSYILSASDDSHVILWHADTLDTLISRIAEDYDVVCVPNASNSVCESDEIVTNADDDRDVAIGFPVQTDASTIYADNSLCLLPDAGVAPSNELIDTSAFSQDAPYVIGYSNGGLNNTSSDWIVAWAEYEASQQALILDFIRLDANGSPNQQILDIELLALDEIDILIINPVEQSAGNMLALQTRIDEIVQMGIPVILVGNRTPEATYTTYVGHDPYEIGCIMAQEMTALVDGEGSIGVINSIDLSVADELFKAGERAVYADFPSILFTAEGPTNYSRTSASNYTRSVEVIGIMGYVHEITLGAQDGLALQNVPYAPFVSDNGISLAQFALDNNIEGVFTTANTQMGAQAVQTALAILQGEDVNQFVRIVPTIISTDVLADYDVASAPANAYLGEWEGLPEEYYPED